MPSFLYDYSKFDGPWRETENHIVITYFGETCGGNGRWSHCRGEPVPASLAGHLSNEEWESLVTKLGNSDRPVRYILCIIVPLSMILLATWIYFINTVDLDSTLFLVYLLIPLGIVLIMSMIQCTAFSQFIANLEKITQEYSPIFSTFDATIKFDIVSVGPQKHKRRIYFISIDLPEDINDCRSMMRVSIPSKVIPGERVIVQTPDNQQVTIGIPLDSKPGDVMNVPLPPPLNNIDDDASLVNDTDDIELGNVAQKIDRRMSHQRVGYRPKAGLVGRYVNRRESVNFKILQPIDTTNDGQVDSVAVDCSGDGQVDTLLKGTPIDINGDGNADVLAVDTNGDGVANKIVPINKSLGLI